MISAKDHGPLEAQGYTRRRPRRPECQTICAEAIVPRALSPFFRSSFLRFISTMKHPFGLRNYSRFGFWSGCWFFEFFGCGCRSWFGSGVVCLFVCLSVCVQPFLSCDAPKIIAKILAGWVGQFLSANCGAPA